MFAVRRKLKLLEIKTSGMNRELSSLEDMVNILRHKLREIQDSFEIDMFNGQLIVEERETYADREIGDNE